MSTPIVKVLFVCLGNICRSPLAEGMLQRVMEQNKLSHLALDSAGTSANHLGENPDPRTLNNARMNGLELKHKARQLKPSDFYEFDWIMCMDRSVMSKVQSLAPSDHKAKVCLYRVFDPEPGDLNVPDPYFGGESGFQNVFDMVKRCTYNIVSDPNFTTSQK